MTTLKLDWTKNFEESRAMAIGKVIRSPDYLTSLESLLAQYLPEFRIKPAVRQHLEEDQSEHFAKKWHPLTENEVDIVYFRGGKVDQYQFCPLEISLEEIKIDLEAKARKTEREINGYAWTADNDSIGYVTLQREEYMNGKIPNFPEFIGFEDFDQWREFFIKNLERRADYYENIPAMGTNQFGESRKEREICFFARYTQKSIMQLSKDMGRDDLAYRFAMIRAEDDFAFRRFRFEDLVEEAINDRILEEAVKVAPGIGREKEISALFQERGWPIKNRIVLVTFRNWNEKENGPVYTDYTLNS